MADNELVGPVEVVAPRAESRAHPRGLYMLFMVEMWERFNYYGMRALLSLFMISSVIGLSKAGSSRIYGAFTALVYLTPVFGGYLADRFIGQRRSITIGAILMAVGQFTMASYELLPPKVSLALGLTFIILGNGFFKPNISSIVGQLYEKNDARRDAGFTLFYMGINLGAFFAPFVCGFLGEPSDPHSLLEAAKWKYGFMAAGGGMLIGLAWYLVAQRRFLGNIGLVPIAKSSGVRAAETPLTSEDWDKIKAIGVFSFFAVFFWCFFEQAGSSLNFFAKEATRLSYTLPLLGEVELKASFFQAVNPIFIVLLAPLFSRFWVRLGDKAPSTPAKFGWGLVLQGVGFGVIALGASLFLKTGPVGAFWLVGVYFFCTTGELCLSPVGLSMVTKLAPAKFISLLMGVWLMSSFFGNLLAGLLASMYETMNLATLFSIPAVMSVLFGVAMWALSHRVRKWMHAVT